MLFFFLSGTQRERVYSVFTLLFSVQSVSFSILHIRAGTTFVVQFWCFIIPLLLQKYTVHYDHVMSFIFLVLCYTETEKVAYWFRIT